MLSRQILENISPDFPELQEAQSSQMTMLNSGTTQVMSKRYNLRLHSTRWLAWMMAGHKYATHTHTCRHTHACSNRHIYNVYN